MLREDGNVHMKGGYEKVRNILSIATKHTSKAPVVEI